MSHGPELVECPFSVYAQHFCFILDQHRNAGTQRIRDHEFSPFPHISIPFFNRHKLPKNSNRESGAQSCG